MKRAWIYFWFLIGVIRFTEASEQGLPEAGVIKNEVFHLGASTPEERTMARKQLEIWADATPRYMLQILSGLYAVETDLERRFQVEELLRDLAARCLFYQPSAFLGVNFSFERLENSESAIRLNSIVLGSPAEKAGLRINDLLLGIGGKTFGEDYDAEAFASQIRSCLPLEPLELRVKRQNIFVVEVLLDPYPMIDSQIASKLEQDRQEIENWLLTLRREDAQTNANEPVGHFRLD